MATLTRILRRYSAFYHIFMKYTSIFYFLDFICTILSIQEPIFHNILMGHGNLGGFQFLFCEEAQLPGRSEERR